MDFTRKGRGLPVGSVVAVPGDINAIQRFWLLCDGAHLDQDDCPELFRIIGQSNGGSVGKFNLPEFRGYFLRGLGAMILRWPPAAFRKQGGNLGHLPGSIQTDQVGPHAQRVTDSGHSYAFPCYLTACGGGEY